MDVDSTITPNTPGESTRNCPAQNSGVMDAVSRRQVPVEVWKVDVSSDQKQTSKMM